jgi:hypothetical protein
MRIIVIVGAFACALLATSVATGPADATEKMS